MQKSSLAALGVIVGLTCGAAWAGDKEDVLKVQAALHDAELHNDTGVLEHLLANELVSINQWGAIRDKRATVQLFKSFHMSSLEESDVSVQVSGDTATVIGSMLESGRDRFLFLETYVKRRDNWLLFSVVHTFRVDAKTLKVFGPEYVHPITGRLYAGMMGMGGADWLVRPDREKQEKPDKAIEALQIAPGSNVADIGAGVGYFAWRLAKVVGPTGKVYANDIQQGMIDKLKQNMADRSITNVVPVLGKPDDPMLPKGTIDLALMVDVYHELLQPQKMLDRIHEALKPGGRLVLVEYRKEDTKLKINALHEMTVADAKAEVEPEGFTLDQVLEILPTQHIIIFRASDLLRGQ